MEAGASRFGREAKAPLLDTEKQLETSSNLTAAQWLKKQEKPEDLWQNRVQLHQELVGTLAKIMDRHNSLPLSPSGEAWLAEYDAQKVTAEGETPAEAWDRAREWAKENKAPRELGARLRWQRTYGQVKDCQKEWIAYKAECCGDNTRPVAVPIGCNHRLCPFCARRRSELARERLKVLFDRFEHPQFLTLTVPNYSSISKHDFTLFRMRVRKLMAQYKGYIKGGVLSLETTYNRRDKTWHLHAHVLFDGAFLLPKAATKVQLRPLIGSEGAPLEQKAFEIIKKAIEFDWLRLWSMDWGRPLRKRKGWLRECFRVEQEQDIFETWIRWGEENRTKTKDRATGIWYRIPGLTDAEFDKRTAWNTENRRVVDIRPVLDRDKAVREVLKYITKVSQFSDCPEAVEEFADATRGARLIQTFGSWYGVDLALDTRFDTEHVHDWGQRKCSCGLNMWTRVQGVFFSHDVEMDSTGQWHLNRSRWQHHCRGTVSRPTIRALEHSPGKEAFDGVTDTYDTTAR